MQKLCLSFGLNTTEIQHGRSAKSTSHHKSRGTLTHYNFTYPPLPTYDDDAALARFRVCVMAAQLRGSPVNSDVVETLAAFRPPPLHRFSGKLSLVTGGQNVCSLLAVL